MGMIKVAEFKTQKGFWYKVKDWISSTSSSVSLPYAGQIRLRINHTNGTIQIVKQEAYHFCYCEFFSKEDNSLVEVFLDKKDIEDLKLLKKYSFVLESHSVEELSLDLKSFTDGKNHKN